MRLNISIDDSRVMNRLNRMAAKGESLRPLMRTCSEIMCREVEKNFAAGGRPTAWKETARSRRDGGKPLTRTARLRRSITADSDDVSARAGTNVKYARIHQLGGKTKPHIIRARNKEVLSWPGARHPVRAVNHPGSNIPARPFLVMTDDGMRQIEKSAEDYFMGGL